MSKEKKDDDIRAIFEGGGGALDAASTKKPARRTFPGISRRAYEHPADRAAMAAMRKLPGADEVIRRMFGMVPEKAWRLFFLANAVRITDQQFAGIHRAFVECCRILDVGDPPELFVTQTPMVNAGAFGMNKPFIVLNSGTLELLDQDELRFVLGHELGHIISDHALYKTMLEVLVAATHFGFGFAIGQMAMFALAVALREWDRKSELSGDRAGLLCVQDASTAYRVHLKMAGGNSVDEMSVDELVRQAEEHERTGNVVDGFLKLLNLIFRSHPFAVLRLAELKRWVDSGDYQKVLEGDYPRRDDDQRRKISDELADAKKSYKEAYQQSADPIARFLQDLGSGIAKSGSDVLDELRGFFGRGGSSGDGE